MCSRGLKLIALFLLGDYVITDEMIRDIKKKNAATDPRRADGEILC